MVKGQPAAHGSFAPVYYFRHAHHHRRRRPPSPRKKEACTSRLRPNTKRRWSSSRVGRTMVFLLLVVWTLVPFLLLSSSHHSSSLILSWIFGTLFRGNDTVHDHPWNQESSRKVQQQPPTLPSHVRQHCNVSSWEKWMMINTNSTSHTSNWQRRTPAFLVVGVKKGGTTALFQTLLRHPRILPGRTKELQFFVPKSFDRFWKHSNNESSNRGSSSSIKDRGRIQVAAARRALYRHHYASAISVVQEQSDVITGEATPDYLMFPHYSAQAILCTLPWVKLIVMLRHPVERLYSHYNYLSDPHHDPARQRQRRRQAAQRQRHGTDNNHTDNTTTMPPFEEWVRRDIAVLQHAGVLPSNLSTLADYMGSAAEQEGWHRYERMHRPGQGTVGSDRHVIRSLYAPQLQGWQDQLHKFGLWEDGTRIRSWKDHPRIKLVLSRDLQSPTKGPEIVSDLFQWLGLSDPTNTTSTTGRGGGQLHQPKRAMITHYTSPPMSSEFRSWLQDTIFRPYNQRLYRLLGPDYHGIFDDEEEEPATSSA